MLSYALEKGFEVLKKNKIIFLPFIVLCIISILSFLPIAKPTFEFTVSPPYTTYPSDFNIYLLKKVKDHIFLMIPWALLIFFISIFANVAGLRVVKDYLHGETTKISDMIKTVMTKGFVAIFAVLSANVLLFLPGIIGTLFYLFAIESIVLTYSYSTVDPRSALFILIASIMFIIQAIILFGLGYYFLSTKFRKFYAIGIISIIILFILGVIAGFVDPLLSFIFFTPLFILLIPISIAVVLIVCITLSLITYIIPSTIVLSDLNATDAIKKSLSFAKENTAKFTILVIITIIIELIASAPSLILSLFHSFSLYLIGIILYYVFMIIFDPYILSFFALAYAFSLSKDKEIKEQSYSALGSINEIRQ